MYMFKKILLFSIFLFLIFHIAFADEVMEIKLSVDKNEVAIGDSFKVSLQLKNASTNGINIGNINIPGINNFNQRGSSQSTKVQMINGSTSAITETIFTLIAVKEGEYQIGPVEISSNGVSVKSNIIKINVSKSNSKSFFNNKTRNSINLATAKNKNHNFNSNLFINIIAFLLLIILIYTFYIRKGNKNQDTVVHQKELSKITSSSILVTPEKNDKKFFEKIKASILLFINEKYGFDTESLTSQEIIDELLSRKIWQANDIIKAIKICDRGYFAMDESGKDELLNIINKLK